MSQRLCSDDGFTIAEFVAASLILFVVLMGVLSAVEYAGATNRMASIRETAINVATSMIERDRNYPTDQLGVKYGNGWYGDPAGEIPATETVVQNGITFTVSTAIWWAVDSSSPSAILPSYKRMRVTVSWATPTAGSLAVETNVWGPNTTGSTILVHAADVDNPATPLTGINIVMDPPTGSNRVVTTGADGIAIWNAVPTGNYATFPDPNTAGLDPNWLVDVSNLGTQTVSAGTRDLGYVYCQRPSTAKIHVHSNSVTNYSGATVTLKDTSRNIIYTAVTGSDGYAYFDAAHATVNGTAGLWKYTGNLYSTSAKSGSSVSTTMTFAIPGSGQNVTGPDLLLPDPPSITISKKVSTTGAALNGVPWSLTFKNPSGTVIGTYSGNANSFTVPISAAGNYTAIVTGVPGFQDNAGFVFAATATGVNQACVVPMFPLFNVGVQLGSAPFAGAQVTVTNALSGIQTTSTAGVTPGVTNANGLVSFGVPADGNYNVSVLVNGVTYNGAQQSLVAASPPTVTDTITIPASTLNVQVNVPTTSGWWRYVAVYDSSGSLVATGTVTNGTVAGQVKTVSFTLPGGVYYPCAGGGSTHTAPPATKPTTGSVWSGTVSSPWWPLPSYTLPTSSSGSVNAGPMNVQS